MPPSASSSFPAFSGVPKSRDPALSRVKPPQFMGMKGPLNRGLALCIAWAKSSLPVPLSPVMSTFAGLHAAARAAAFTLRMTELSAIMSWKLYTALCLCAAAL